MCTLNITYLNLVLGVPPTDLHHISAFMQVSSVEPSAISAYTGTRNCEQAEGLRLPTYIDRQR